MGASDSHTPVEEVCVCVCVWAVIVASLQLDSTATLLLFFFVVFRQHTFTGTAGMTGFLCVCVCFSPGTPWKKNQAHTFLLLPAGGLFGGSRRSL